MHERDVRRAGFARLKEWSVAGLKVDFFNGDQQDIVRLYLDLVENAADFGLLVNTHGATLPRGWSRTCPNLLTMEAVRGAEL